MLSLASTTPRRFVDWFEANTDTMLVDHAHCEKKAASTALNFLFRYTDNPALVRTMSEIVQEEMEHFDQVVDIIEARGGQLERLSPSTYAAKLYKHCRKPEPASFVDRMLLSALIEARSCERFALLGKHLRDTELAQFYQSLFEAEARHYATYLKLALAVWDDEAEVRARLDQFAQIEAAIAAEVDDEPRLHSGVPAHFTAS